MPPTLRLDFRISKSDYAPLPDRRLMSYTKLFSSIVHSSLWSASDPTRLLFITMLAMADKEGVVYGSRSGLARVANISPELAEVAFAELLGPDPNSSDALRSPENEGRRIEVYPGGFRLLNFSYYRAIRNEEERREQNRRAQERFRVRHRNENQPSEAAGKPISEAEADTETYSPPTPSLRRNHRHPFKAPTVEDVEARISEKSYTFRALDFIAYHQARGWMLGRTPMKDWKAAMLTWQLKRDRGEAP